MYKYVHNYREFPKDENGNTSVSRFIEKSDTWYFMNCGYSAFIVEKNDEPKKYIKVNDSESCVYKLNKTSVSAIGGACGLYRWLVNEIEADPFPCRAVQVLQHMHDNCKPYNPKIIY